MANRSPEESCWGKDPHPTREAAAKAANIGRALFGGRSTAYGCPFCGAFHAGHEARMRGDRQSRRARKRRERYFVWEGATQGTPVTTFQW